MEERNGYVEHIIYRNVENGYTVFEFACGDGDDEILETCVGTFPFINEGEYMVLHGNVVTHPTYHEQFKVEKSESRDPDDVMSDIYHYRKRAGASERGKGNQRTESG